MTSLTPGTPMARRRALPLLAALVAALQVGAVAHAQADPPSVGPAPPVLGCSWAPVGAGVELVAEVEDADEEGDDGAEASEVEQAPRIVGSLAAPPNVRRNDQRRLGALAPVSRDQAVQAALAALPDADRRRVGDVELEVEQGYVVWDVETVLRGRERGPDRHADVIVDAGSGRVLFVECEADDD